MVTKDERTENILLALKTYAEDSWVEPHRSTEEDDKYDCECLEFWKGDRKITIYIPPSPLPEGIDLDFDETDDLFVIKVHSSDPYANLEDLMIGNQEDLFALWDWLIGIERDEEDIL